MRGLACMGIPRCISSAEGAPPPSAVSRRVQDFVTIRQGGVNHPFPYRYCEGSHGIHLVAIRVTAMDENRRVMQGAECKLSAPKLIRMKVERDPFREQFARLRSFDKDAAAAVRERGHRADVRCH